MSDIKIQNAPAVPAGAQEPLANDNDQRSTHGFVGSQVFPLSGRSGVEVARGSAGLCKPNNADGAAARPIESVNQMFVSAPVAVSVAQVDHKVIEGSHGGGSDFRKQASPAVLPANPAPRAPKGQAYLNSRTPAASAPQSFPGNLSDSDSGN